MLHYLNYFSFFLYTKISARAPLGVQRLPAMTMIRKVIEKSRNYAAVVTECKIGGKH